MAFFADLRQDLRYALRVLSRDSGYTLVGILTIALGTGVSTAMFSIFNAVALKPLPVAQADQVVRLKRWFQNGSQGDIQYSFSYPEFTHIRDRSEIFSSVVASSSMIPVMAVVADASAGRPADPERLQIQLVSANYFSSLGLAPELGRTFLGDEDRVPGASPVLVLSHASWQRRFNGDSNVIGRTVAIGAAVFTIIGVIPQKFTGTNLFPQVPDFWVPVSMQAAIVPGQARR
jgi:hypothetical protein